MPELRSEFLLELRIELEGSHIVGRTPMGLRRMDYFTGGHVKGPRVNGVILPGGSDVLTGRADGAMLPDVRLTLLVGAYAQAHYLAGRRGQNLTQTVQAWRDLGPGLIPLPHPSWRTTAWQKRNPWFDTELLPELRARVQNLLAG